MTDALLLIDIQNDYFPGGKMELSGSDRAAQHAALVLAAAREKRIPVIHIQHISSRPDAPFFLPDTTGAGIHRLVYPQPGEEIIIKHFPNSFRETALQEYITRKGIDHLLVCGMMTHMCVDATVRAAADLGYRCTLAADACATRDLVWDGNIVPAAHVHHAFLAALSGLYAKIIPAAVMAGDI